SRTARPLVFVMDLPALVVVIGIIKTGSVGEDGGCTGNSVVQNPLHAVAIPRVARHTQQIARNFEVAVGTAWSLKARVGGSQTGIEQPLAGSHKGFIRAPAAGGITLLLDHAQAIVRRAEIFLIPEHKICLHGRTESVDVTVGVFPGENVL